MFNVAQNRQPLRRWASRLLALLLCSSSMLAATAQSSAQDEPAPVRNLAMTAPTDYLEPPAYVQMVPSQGFSYFAASEPTGKLIFARNTSLPQFAMLQLTATGEVDSKTKAVGFSLAGNVDKKIVNKVLAIATHPTQPVLYVWQDIGTQTDNIVTPKGDELKYSHLLVYDISGAQPKLLMSTCSGIDFMYGRSTAMLTLGNQGKRLYVPNLRFKVTRGQGVALGVYRLDAKGLPILTGADPENDPASVSGVSETDQLPEENAEPAVESEEDIDKVTSGRGGGLTMLHMSAVGSRYQVGRAFYIDDAHTVMRTGNYLTTYDASNRSGRIASVILPNNNTRSTRITLNQSLDGKPQQMVYWTHPSSVYLGAWPLFQGYPSLLPQTIALGGFRAQSDMIHVPKHERIALGSSNRVLLIKVDSQGWLQDHMEQIKVPAALVQHLIYSQKFDRLYIGTDEKLEVSP